MSVRFGGFVHMIGEESLSAAARAVVSHYRTFYKSDVLGRLSNVSITGSGEVVEVLHFLTGADHFCMTLANGSIINYQRRDYMPEFYEFGGTKIGAWEDVPLYVLFFHMTDVADRINSVNRWLEVQAEWEWLESAELVTEQDENDDELALLLEMAWDGDRYAPLSPEAWDRLRTLSFRDWRELH